jgi:hypothetical protein
MPTLDVVIKGQMVLPEVSAGPLPPGSGGSPEHPIYNPPGVNVPVFPTFPIVIPPEFIADVHPEHPIVIPPPAMPPGIWPSPGHPSHPIAPGGGPSQGPGFPTHPIVIPPDVDVWPPNAKPEHPIVVPPPTTIWPPLPTHPIIVPPEGPPEVLEKWEVVAYWTPAGGWAMAIVPTESHPGVPTPA